jgi:GTP-binding protein
MPDMIALARLPDLYSRNCFSKYSGCCPANLGLAGVVELPSAAWQATQICAYFVLPAPKSGLTVSACAVATNAKEQIRVAKDFMVFRRFLRVCQGQRTAALCRNKANILQCRELLPHMKPSHTPNSTPSSPAVVTPVGWLHTARFLTTAPELQHLPPIDVPEIAFVGRSNAGKSTCINTLTQQRRLAFASKTPGRTQSINLFALGKQNTTDAVFADLPGYGYAAVPQQAKRRWQQVMANYLVSRKSLTGIVMLCDARLGLTELDELLLEVIRPRVEDGLKFLVLLTKADKLTRAEANKAMSIAKLQTAGGDLALFSALKKQGIDQVAQTLWDWSHPVQPADAGAATT